MEYDSETFKSKFAEGVAKQKAFNDKFAAETGIKSSGSIQPRASDPRWFMNPSQFGYHEAGYMEGDDVEKDWDDRETSFESSLDSD